MAADRKPFFLFRPRFLLLCLYVAAYWILRNYGEVAIQSVFLPSPAGTQVYRIVGPNPDLPHYRQQLWRALFSLPMVAEEEGRKLTDRGREIYDNAEGTVREGQRMIDQYLPSGQGGR
ncbi:MAG: hypothetical protein LUC93_18075 [Planctomycetaceae bacterium]|nr:hypothetical protein [Planctomycetaceae bacterium]